MIRDLDAFLDLLREHEMTPSQLLLCLLLHANQTDTTIEGDESPLASLYRYSETVRPWTDDEIQDLVDRGYLEASGAQNAYPDTLRVTSTLTRALRVETSRFEAFWNAYPAFAPQEDAGSAVCLKHAPKAEVRATFQQEIATHADYVALMKTLTWAKNRGRVTVEIRTYLAETWRTHRAQRRTHRKSHRRTFARPCSSDAAD
jgi:hypothetical protein